MPRSSTTIEVIRRREKYEWPSPAINLWWIIMLATGGVLIGVFAQFVNIQNHFNVGIPWLFPYGITVGALTVIYIIYALILINQQRLLPVVVMILTFILFALYLAGLIETAIQLFGAGANVNGNCQTYVMGMPQSGQTLNTLAWLEQQSICQQWYAVFAFWIVGALFLVWVFIIAATVNSNGGTAY